jgi:hypothetical protein
MKSPPETLSDLSSLTRIQVQTLKTHRAVQNAQINMLDALKTRKNSGISRGTHYRILGQARKNVKESLFTVAVAVQLGFLRVDDVQKLLATVSMIPVEVDPEKLPEIMELVRVLADRIVMI